MSRNKFRISSSSILLVSICFWATVIFVRSIIFLFVRQGMVPAIFIHGYHIHHFVTGFLFLLIAVFFASKKILSHYIPLILIGSGLGLVSDEFLFWTRGYFNYWSLINFGVVSITGAILVFIYLYSKRQALPSFVPPRRIRSNPKNPLVSVVIPAYNEERYLTQTLASLQNQDFSNFEIIVVDNNSTDSTAAIARSWGARVISQPQPGVAKTRQAGFYAARGTIIVTTDADTIFPEDWLSRIVYLFKIHPEAVAVGGLYNLYSGSLFARLFFRYIAFWFWKIDRWRMGNWSLPGCNLAVRATSFYKIGGFNTYLNVMEDAELCQRLKHIGTILFDPKLRVATSGRAYRNGLIIGLWRYIPRILHWEFSKQGKNNPLPVVRDEGPALLLILTSLIIAVLLLANFYSFQNAGLAEARQDLNEKCQHLITFVKPTHIINTWKNMQVHLP